MSFKICIGFICAKVRSFFQSSKLLGQKNPDCRDNPGIPVYLDNPVLELSGLAKIVADTGLIGGDGRCQIVMGLGI